MTINPELRRQAWLGLTVHRLVAVPLVLLALGVIVAANTDEPAFPLASGALAIFTAVTLCWGTYRAFNDVAAEVEQRTWDSQRMAALTPCSLMLGKVLGAPLFTWYVGLWCLAVYVPSATTAGLERVASTVAVAVVLALMLHALATAASTLAAGSDWRARGLRLGSATMLMLMMLLAVWVEALVVSERRAPQRLDWWIWRDLDVVHFALLSAVLFMAWAFVGAWQAMARELREPPLRAAWPIFAAFAALWWTGIEPSEWTSVNAATALALTGLVLVLAAYLGLALDPLTPVSWARLQRMGHLFSRRHAPGWLQYGLLALVLSATSLLVAMFTQQDSHAGRTPSGQLGLLPSATLPVALMLLRDAAILTIFSLTARVRRPLALAVFYIAVGDLLLPTLLDILGQSMLARIVFPLSFVVSNPFYAIAGTAAHVVLAVAVLWWRWPCTRAVAIPRPNA